VSEAMEAVRTAAQDGRVPPVVAEALADLDERVTALALVPSPVPDDASTPEETA